MGRILSRDWIFLARRPSFRRRCSSAAWPARRTSPSTRGGSAARCGAEASAETYSRARAAGPTEANWVSKAASRRTSGSVASAFVGGGRPPPAADAPAVLTQASVAAGAPLWAGAAPPPSPDSSSSSSLPCSSSWSWLALAPPCKWRGSSDAGPSDASRGHPSSATATNRVGATAWGPASLRAGTATATATGGAPAAGGRATVSTEVAMAAVGAAAPDASGGSPAPAPC
eukprot:scaffold4963_cov97-Isochrysis_galbana.AAC.6